MTFGVRRLGLCDRVLSPRLLTEPWRQEERCVRAGENGSPRRFVFSSFTSLFDSFKQAFRHDGNTAFVRTFYYNVTAIRVPAAFAPRDSEPARRGRSPALSYRDERARKLYLETRTRSRMPHVTYTDLYTG